MQDITKTMQKYLSDKEVESDFRIKFREFVIEHQGRIIASEQSVVNFILSQRKQDREAIREWAESKKVWRAENKSEAEVERKRLLTDLLSFLDGLERE